VNGSKPQAYKAYYPILKVEKSGARASDSAPGRRLRLEGEDEQPGGFNKGRTVWQLTIEGDIRTFTSLEDLIMFLIPRVGSRLPRASLEAGAINNPNQPLMSAHSPPIESRLPKK
jgi:hypothetical protein